MLKILSRELLLERCPGAFCHASTLALGPGGSRYCCFFAGSKEGAADCSIYGSAWEGGRWQPPRPLAAGDEAHWNPVLWWDEARQELVLFYKKGQRIATWRSYVRRSSDWGRSWSAEAQLVPGDEGGRGPVRNKLLELAEGGLLAGASTERGLWQAYADLSRDGGRSWQLSPPIRIPGLRWQAGDGAAPASPIAAKLHSFASRIAVSLQSFLGRGVIQPSLWQDAQGVHMLLRSSEGWVYRADSQDGGSSFGSPYPLQVPNNNSGLDVAYDGRRLYLACNPVGENWGSRSPLSLLSSPDGLSFVKELDVETGPGEYSYPCLLYRDGLLYLTYTWRRQNIALVRLALA